MMRRNKAPTAVRLMSHFDVAGPVAMVRVQASEDPDDPLVLIVDNNPMGTMRLSQVFTQMGWRIEVCEDGDLAVDTYVQLRPDLVLLALDIPTLDGHTAALELRESDGGARIAFMAPRHQRELAADATHSAGAVAWLEKPITKQILDDNWEMIMGEIPEAPGLADLDSLYPEDVDVQRAKREDEDIVEVATAMPLPALPALPALPVPSPAGSPTPSTKGKRKRRPGRGLRLIAAGLFMGSIGAICGAIWLLYLQ
jgi:CheY-like chemotaxis protein